MTEEKWLTFTTLYEGECLSGVRLLLTERKCRLFAVACARRIWKHIPNGVSKQLIEALEGTADGMMTEEEWEAYSLAANIPEGASPVEERAVSVVVTCQMDWSLRLFSNTVMYCRSTIAADSHFGETRRREREEELAQCDLLRDLIANPFRPLILDPAWLTSTVLALATGMYGERAFDRMPILADALQDAGCDNEDILSHCRGDGPHVRGCWVIDLLTGRK